MTGPQVVQQIVVPPAKGQENTGKGKSGIRTFEPTVAHCPSGSQIFPEFCRPTTSFVKVEAVNNVRAAIMEKNFLNFFMHYLFILILKKTSFCNSIFDLFKPTKSSVSENAIEGAVMNSDNSISDPIFSPFSKILKQCR